MNKIYIGISIVALIIAGIFIFSGGKRVENGAVPQEGDVVEEGDGTGGAAGGTVLADSENPENMVTYTGTVIAGTSAPLLDFNKADYDTATQTNKLIVLYFYANWCPICKVETAQALYPAFNELDSNRVVGFRVNFNDSETDSAEKALAGEYGVPYQHTKVFVKNGEVLLNSPGEWTKDRYLTEINKVLAAE
jgi:thiol-disulfide isomerase/thioredoxin